MTEENKIRHHFVPAFYLRGFVGGEGLLWVYDKRSDKEFSNIPDNLGYSKNYHTFTTEDGREDTNSIENYLSEEWEGPAARIIAAILDGVFPAGEDRTLFANFLGLCFTRSPNHRANVNAVLVDALKQMAHLRAATPERFTASLESYERETGERLTDDPEELRRDILDDNYEVVPEPGMYLQSFIDLGLSLGGIIEKMTWCYFRTSSGPGFLTSDNPISLYDPTVDPGSFYNGTGFANPAAQFTFPVSQNLALVGVWGDRSDEGFSDARPEVVDAINLGTILATERFVYVAEPSDQVREWVRGLAGTRPTISIDR